MTPRTTPAIPSFKAAIDMHREHSKPAVPDAKTSELESELEVALEVGQYLLDQNQSLDASLRSARIETDWLLSLLAHIDADVVEAAMADLNKALACADNDKNIVQHDDTLIQKRIEEMVREKGEKSQLSAPNLSHAGNSLDALHNLDDALDTLDALVGETDGGGGDHGGDHGAESELRNRVDSATTEINKLHQQIENITARNTDLRIANLELLLELDSYRNGTTSHTQSNPLHTDPSSVRITELESRFREYNDLVHTLKSQLDSLKSQTPAPTGYLQQQQQEKSPASVTKQKHDLISPVSSSTIATKQSVESISSLQHNQRLLSASSAAKSFGESASYETNPPRNSVASLHSATSLAAAAANDTAATLNTVHSPQKFQKIDSTPHSQAHHHNPHAPSPTATNSTSSTHPNGHQLISHPSTNLTATPPKHNTSPAPITTLLQNPSIQHTLALLESPHNSVNAIVKLMCGAYLLKFNRRRTKGEVRFVAVNPYTRTVSWSKSEPGFENGEEITTVYMQTVFVEDLSDGRSRIVVTTRHREVVFQCSSAAEHAIWERGLTLILQNNNNTKTTF